jgi:dolichyl-phosphate-mannose--protein O-mannosyl transferase
MTPSFQKTLIGNKYYEDPSIKPASTFLKFLELNTVMYTANANLKAAHSYGSQWYTWPFLLRPIYYWFGAGEGNQSSRIYLQGNPFIWWLGLVVFVYWLLWLVRQFFKKIKDSDFFPILLLVVGYIGNMLAYVFVDRVAFLYHYFPSLLFLIVGLGVFFAKYFSKSKIILISLVLIIILFFQFFAPLSYGLPLTETSFQERVWFKSWQ